jgi:hypothetical protein
MVALATLFECVAERAREFDVIHCHLQQSTRAAAEVDTITTRSTTGFRRL